MGVHGFRFLSVVAAAEAAAASAEAAAASATAVAVAHVIFPPTARDLWIKHATRCRMIRRPRDSPYPHY